MNSIKREILMNNWSKTIVGRFENGGILSWIEVSYNSLELHAGHSSHIGI